jgi:glycerophosphoryl diester phosphodiesterase
VGSWFNERHAARARPEYATQRIPTLDEVFSRYAGRARFYIETKNPEAAPGMEEALLALLERHHLRMTGELRWSPPPPVVIQSFSMASLRKLRTLAPDLPLVWLVDSDADSRSIITALDEVAGFANGIGPHRSSVDAALVAAAHARALVVHPYTVNDETHMRALIALNVGGMFTDAPDRLSELLKR